MQRKTIIIIAVIAFIVILSVWIWIRITAQEKDLYFSQADNAADHIPTGLRGRMLVWETNANVPLRLASGGNGVNLFDLLGVPRGIQPFQANITRVPVSDEWNVAVLILDENRELDEVKYLTEDSGNYLHPRPDGIGRYIVATRNENNSRDIVKIDIENGDMEVVSFSHSIDRWPSISSDGTTILFHSFRDKNPCGDLYLAVENRESDDGWNIHRLTDDTEVEHVWAMMDASASACIAVEREIGDDVGRIVLWYLSDNCLEELHYITSEPGEIKHPSLSVNGEYCCWQERVDGIWSVVVWEKDEDERTVIGPASDPPHSGYGWGQPSISSDGRYVAFVDDRKGVGADRIGIYDLESGDLIFFDGCGGNVMFPSLTSGSE